MVGLNTLKLQCLNDSLEIIQNEENVQINQKVHFDGERFRTKDFECKECGKKSSDKSNVVKHINTVH